MGRRVQIPPSAQDSGTRKDRRQDGKTSMLGCVVAVPGRTGWYGFESRQHASNIARSSSGRMRSKTSVF